MESGRRKAGWLCGGKRKTGQQRIKRILKRRNRRESKKKGKGLKGRNCDEGESEELVTL